MPYTPACRRGRVEDVEQEERSGTSTAWSVCACYGFEVRGTSKIAVDSMMTPADRTYRVLIVDHEASVLKFIERVLATGGYETRMARDAAEALAIFQHAARFDLLLTDLIMPAMPGDELAATIRRTHPDMKVLYITGHSDRLSAERPVLWQDEAFIDKPISPAFGHMQGLP
jgi:CheY-like chemotaxis protein